MFAIVAAGAVCALLFFTIQLTLCFKSKSKAIKLIPIYPLIILVLIVIADLTGMFDDGGGFISASGIVAIPLAVIIGIALVGEAAAWIVCGIHKRKRNS